jgi:hypothetical protein
MRRYRVPRCYRVPLNLESFPEVYRRLMWTIVNRSYYDALRDGTLFIVDHRSTTIWCRRIEDAEAVIAADTIEKSGGDATGWITSPVIITRMVVR